MPRLKRHCVRCLNADNCPTHDRPERDRFLCPECGTIWGGTKIADPKSRPIRATKLCVPCRRGRLPVSRVLDGEAINQVLEWKEKGARSQTIADHLGVSVSVIKKIWMLRDIW